MNSFMCEMALKGTMIIFICASLFSLAACLYFVTKEILLSLKYRDVIRFTLTVMLEILFAFFLICFLFDICPDLLRFA